MKTKTNILYLHLVIFLMLIFFFCFFCACEKDNRVAVYSIEILINDEVEDEVLVNQNVTIGLTVNNYQKEFNFERFYAHITFNESEEIKELNYGNNEITFVKIGDYQIKVSIIDDYRRFVTKLLPIIVKSDNDIGEDIEEPPIDNEAPVFTGDIKNYIYDNSAVKIINAYVGIGLILPDFSVTDNSEDDIIITFNCLHGKVFEYFVETNGENKKIYYYLCNENNIVEELSIIASDKSNNSIIKLKIKTGNTQIYSKWFINSQIYTENLLLIGPNLLIINNNIANLGYIIDSDNKNYKIKYNFIEKNTVNSSFNIAFIYDINNNDISIEYNFESNNYTVKNSENDFEQYIINNINEIEIKEKLLYIDDNKISDKEISAIEFEFCSIEIIVILEVIKI